MIQVDVIPSKRLELTQTVASLIVSVRKEKGCLCCEFGRSMEDENRLFVLEAWDTREDLVDHLKSGKFGVLRGAVNLFKQPGKRAFHRIYYQSKTEEYQY